MCDTVETLPFQMNC